jgi:hypothetical protein
MQSTHECSTTDHETLAPTAPEKGRVSRAIARVLLGLVLVANAPVGTLVPIPPAGPGGDALIDALWHSPYIMVLAKLVELTVGLALLSNRFVPLALTIFAPVLINIVAFQASFSPHILPLGLAMVGMTTFLAWQHRTAYAPLFVARRARAVVG